MNCLSSLKAITLTSFHLDKAVVTRSCHDDPRILACTLSAGVADSIAVS
jgi:hypothetical protein